MAQKGNREALPVFFQEPSAKRGKSWKLKLQEFAFTAILLISVILYLWLLGK
jgi:hypothetical protein